MVDFWNIAKPFSHKDEGDTETAVKKCGQNADCTGLAVSVLGKRLIENIEPDMNFPEMVT